ncbi:MAG: hypothetical protein VR74_00710 [Hyphomonas sp. BRH_c22]|uniref:arylsulfotransferase family protein n=1 Tax=Hyphomonas sp. BRH_c22 TaxID=1629710 RepID=UPI0005F26B3A|nr:arylsulfotransferase family protein [Hyphomonas sp. BRH_c22]KJS39738.1 MAG: hypothetical protein VR74_00710 [Hyphomonas sp. BRH_c22]
MMNKLKDAMRMMKKDADSDEGIMDRVLFGTAVAFAVFAAGMASAHYKVFPYPVVVAAKAALVDLKDNWRSDAGVLPTRFLSENTNGKSGLTLNRSDLTHPGYTLVSGLFDDQVAVRMLDMEGETVHQWPVPFELVKRYAKEIDYVDVPLDEWSYQITGIVAEPDGSMTLNAGAMFMKLDACGNHEWTLPTATHHMLNSNKDGTFWGLGFADHEKPPAEWRTNGDPLREDLFVKFSADGVILQKISLWDVLLKNNLHSVIGANGQTPVFQNGGFDSDDSFHTNDIEMLTAQAAAGIPLAQAGDLMVSARNINLVIIFDPDTLDVHWWQAGPWIRQHDPDIMPDGRISVFNNNRENADHGGSNIMAIDPVTRATEILYPKSEDQYFYSNCCGMHQHLPNGNMLITIEQEGRLLEVTSEGEAVWDYTVRYDDKHVIKIFDGVRYDADFFEPDAFSTCEASEDLRPS